MKMKKWLFICLLCTAFAHGRSAERIRVACVGNSVTYGYGVENREVNCYPARLQALLGEGYEVANFGHSGTTLLRHGHRPYVNVPEYEAALGFKPDRVVIHLGLNDTDPRNWPNYGDEFVADYLSLIDAFRQANPSCRIWICRMTPIFHDHPRFLSGTRDWFWQEQEAIETVAQIAGLPVIDLHGALYDRPDLFPDALHPDAEGDGILARTVYSALTGDYGGLALPPIYGDGMVLQREVPLRISGTADAGETVSVSVQGQKASAVTGGDGRWKVVLEPLALSAEPLTMVVETARRRIVLHDILVGDVWLCSGQSNMAFRLEESVAEEAAAGREYASRRPAIRLFDRKVRWNTDAVHWRAEVLDSLDRLQYYRETSWTPCTPETAARFSAVGMAFGRTLADSIGVPIGLVCNAVGGSPTEAWIDRKSMEFEFPEILHDWMHNDFVQDWVRERALFNVSSSDNPRQRHPYEPCYLFEAGMKPLSDFSFKGAVWYQGESNAHNVEAHERLFLLLVKSWRKVWGAAFPVYYVQLSGIARPSWPRFRDSQRRLMNRLPNMGMAVSSDLGDSLNVHPQHKAAVGERLARWALNKTYGFDIVPSGPLFRRAERRGGSLYVSFDYGEGLHGADGGRIRTFEVAEYDGLYYPAEAEAVDDGFLRVWSGEVKTPRYVRYGWQPFTTANLVNGEGLPASTFWGEASDGGGSVSKMR